MPPIEILEPEVEERYHLHVLQWLLYPLSFQEPARPRMEMLIMWIRERAVAGMGQEITKCCFIMKGANNKCCLSCYAARPVRYLRRSSIQPGCCYLHVVMLSVGMIMWEPLTLPFLYVEMSALVFDIPHLILLCHSGMFTPTLYSSISHYIILDDMIVCSIICCYIILSYRNRSAALLPMR